MLHFSPNRHHHSPFLLHLPNSPLLLHSPNLPNHSSSPYPQPPYTPPSPSLSSSSSMADSQTPKHKRLAKGMAIQGVSSNLNPTSHRLYLERLFSSREQQARYLKYFERCQLVVPRYLHRSVFANSNLKFYQVLSDLDLLEFSYLHAPIYPDLVKVFYSNLSYNFDIKTLTTEVKTKQISIPLPLWSEITKLPTDGPTFLGGPLNVWGDKFDKFKARQSLFRPNTDFRAKIIRSKYLTKQNRLLHYVLVRCLIPRASNYARVLDIDTLLLWAMKHEKPLNWSWYVIWHMLDHVKRAKDEKSCSLPYAMLITLILRKFKVPLNEEFKEEEKRTMCIQEATIFSMGWMKVDDEWVPKMADDGGDGGSGLDSAVEHQDHPPLLQAPPPAEHIPPYMQQFMDEMKGRFDTLTDVVTQGFATMNVHLDELSWNQQHGDDS